MKRSEMQHPLREGIPFLGFQFSITGTGKVLMMIDAGRVKAQKKKLLRLVNKAKDGKVPAKNVDMAYAAWRNHASKGNNYKMIRRMDDYYKRLWEGERR